MTGEPPQDHPAGEPTSGIALRVLGHFDLVVNGVSLELPVQVQKVLAFLALCDGSQPRERVAEQVWPCVDLRHCMGSLRTVLWRIRQVSPDTVRAPRGSVALGPSVRVDLQEAWATSRQILDGRPVDPTGAVQLLSRPLLPDWDEPWALLEQERVKQMSVHCLETLSRQLVAEAQYAYAMQAAEAACGIEPLRESARRAVIDIHLAEGNRAQARWVYEDFRRLLRAEMGIEPSAQLMSSFTTRARPTLAAARGGEETLLLSPDRVQGLWAGLSSRSRTQTVWTRRRPQSSAV
jgi:DNA-binding SARP family transcriptional activator